MFYPIVGKSKIVCRKVRNVLLLWLGKTLDIWHPEKNFAGHRDRLLKVP
jgi:hypothetical protein